MVGSPATCGTSADPARVPPVGYGRAIRLSLPAFAAVLVLLAAGCGGGSDDSATTTQPSSESSGTGTTTPVSAAATTEDVRIDAGALTLEGDLRLPSGDEPAPAVVFIHGSGPIDRDGTMTGQLNMVFGFDLPLFGMLGAELQDAGYAVLTYDKRSCGTFNECADNDYPPPTADITITDFVDDAVAVVEFLRVDPRVDPDRIAVIGHSQGGQLVPSVIAASGAAAGVVMAGPFNPIDQSLRFQAESSRELLSSAGATPDQIDTVVGPLDQMAADVEALRSAPDTTGIVAGAPAGFWFSWLQVGDVLPQQLAARDEPMLVISGDVDWNVPPAETEAWRTAIGTGPANRIEVLPCVTHAFNCVAADDPASIQSEDIGRELDPAAVAAIIDFLDANL